MEKTEIIQAGTGTEIKNMMNMRPSYLEIDLDAFSYNFRKIKSIVSSDTKIMAVVKANAYGHGIVEIARQAARCGAAMLGVAFIEEGEILIRSGIDIPINILYPDSIGRASRVAGSGMIATVSSIDYLKALNDAESSYGKKVRVFLKVETGMGRYGADCSDMQSLMTLARQMKGIEVIGVSTNLADSNSNKSGFTDRQFAEFERCLNSLDIGHGDFYRSIENSSGVLNHHQNKFNLVRVGLLLYGISPGRNAGIKVLPVLSLKSEIIQLKKWQAGKPLGYSGSFIPKRDSVIATIGLGYADGYPWSLSNKSRVLVNGYEAPIVGKICMDAMLIDVTDVPDCQTGDEVVLIGKSGDQEITVDELAPLAGSFAYEFLSGFSVRLPRVYKGGDVDQG
jgi:alanine racemase